MRITKTILFAPIKRRFVARVLSLVILVSILPIVLAPLALPTTTHAQQVEVLQFKDKTADGFFSSLDSTGCIQTDVFLLLSQHREKTQPDGSKLFVTSATIFVSVVDLCNNFLLRSAFGSTEQITYDFGGNLDSARVQAVIPVVDAACSNCTYDIAVDFAWTGQGDITTSRFRETVTSPGMAIVTRFKGSFRAAAASGTVNIVGSSDNLTPAGSQIDANLQQLQAGTVAVIRD